MMGIGALFSADLGGRVAGADDPTVLVGLAGGDPDDVMVAVLADLSEEARAALVAKLQGDQWAGIIVTRDEHPSLPELIRWAIAHPAVILLGSPSGPPPPAILVFERAPDA